MNLEGVMANQIEEENAVEEALKDAGLSGIAKAPRVGTPAYQRLVDTAIKYMEEVKKAQNATVFPVDPIYDSGENYFKKEKKTINIGSSSSDTIRRTYHNALSNMLIGKPRDGLPKREADQLSNFAAYLTGDIEYINKW